MTNRFMSRRRAGLLLAGFLGASATALAASPAQAADLGGVDLVSYCYGQGDGYSPQVWGDTVYNWVCYKPANGLYDGIDMSQACAQQYGGGAEARFSNYNDAYSWYCWRP